ncbi:MULTISPECIES: hypothetical protein [Roseomonadaceae]|uniref:Nudix hydrolase domain-containing protein n=1 Tax=Falsiroseomonas oleicola TaxID=2801474 RepID=A0ABS6HD24_9PROT|nr:hypothetical protein [Roseomonas oleicola]MBU8546329.1 hypothetical protein [Roseomonas oleicola]
MRSWVRDKLLGVLGVHGREFDRDRTHLGVWKLRVAELERQQREAGKPKSAILRGLLTAQEERFVLKRQREVFYANVLGIIGAMISVIGFVYLMIDVSRTSAAAVSIWSAPSIATVAGAILALTSLLLAYAIHAKSVRDAMPNLVRRKLEGHQIQGREEFLSISLPHDYIQSEYVLRQFTNGIAVWSPSVCRALVAGQDIKVKKGKKFEPTESATYKVMKLRVHEKIIQGASIRNEDKCRLAADILTAEGNLVVVQGIVQETDYYALLATDYSSGFVVHEFEDEMREVAGVLVYDGFSLFTTRTAESCRELRPLSNLVSSSLPASASANVIGVSAILITSDMHVFLTRQRVESVASGGMLAPSGSGSVDWLDAEKLPAGEFPLMNLLMPAMRREILEEAGLLQAGRPEKPMDIALMPVGFARLLHHAGKPEFFFMGRINAGYDEIQKSRAWTSEERLFTNGCVGFNQQLDPRSMVALRASWRALISEIRAVPEVKISCPLDIQILCVDAVLETDETARLLMNFLRSEAEFPGS